MRTVIAGSVTNSARDIYRHASSVQRAFQTWQKDYRPNRDVPVGSTPAYACGWLTADYLLKVDGNLGHQPGQDWNAERIQGFWDRQSAEG
jgi:hypothetical protein